VGIKASDYHKMPENHLDAFRAAVGLYVTKLADILALANQ